jgi:hypothetical protein
VPALSAILRDHQAVAQTVMAETDDLRRYLALLERLTPDTMTELDSLLTDDVRFVDPFHDVSGRNAMRAVLAKMFADLDQVRFMVKHVACAQRIGFASWTLTGVPRSSRLKRLTLQGVSEIHLDHAGRVTTHIDYWDVASQLYEYVPVLGRVLAAVRRRIARVRA